jgi:hypothetical protein
MSENDVWLLHNKNAWHERGTSEIFVLMLILQIHRIAVKKKRHEARNAVLYAPGWKLIWQN